MCIRSSPVLCEACRRSSRTLSRLLNVKTETLESKLIQVRRRIVHTYIGLFCFLSRLEGRLNRRLGK